MSEALYYGSSGSEHTVSQVMVGEIEALRPRLIAALEQLDYQVINEQPIQARRGARGAARWGCSFEPLESSANLTVALKQLNSVATLVTFSYEIKHLAAMSGGDRQTLKREAEAIVALAAQRATLTACAACGTEVTDDSRFCRRCGVPLNKELAELEVLRLTAGTRAGYQRIVTSLLILLTTLLISLALFWGDTAKSIRAAWMILSIGSVLAFLLLLWGMWRTHRTLNPPQTKETAALAEAGRALNSTSYRELPPTSAQPSVTEGTTELLEQVKEPVPVRVRRESGEVV